MVNCRICGKDFKNSKSFTQHLGHPKTKSSHNISGTKDYYDRFIKSETEGICSGCGKETFYFSFDRGYLKYCSHICYWSDPEYNKKRSKDNKKSWLNSDSGHNSRECRKKMSEAAKRRWKDPNDFCNSSERKKQQRKLILKMKEDGTGPFTEKSLEKISKKMKELWEDPNCVWRSKEWLDKVIPKRKAWMRNGGAAYINSFNKSPSKPQVELFNIIQKLCPYPVLNYPCLNYSIDIAVPKLSLAIEYDGSYWHQDAEYDRKRQDELEQEGWVFLRYIDEVPSKNDLIDDILVISKEI